MSIVYLSKENQPSRISSRDLARYKVAKSQGLSANNAYNRQVLGIDSLRYRWISIAIHHVCGMCDELATVKNLNAWLAEPGYLTDEDGRYLSYMGNTVSVSV